MVTVSGEKSLGEKFEDVAGVLQLVTVLLDLFGVLLLSGFPTEIPGAPPGTCVVATFCH